MVVQFIYTETDVPGPFKVEGGFKVKCAVVPKEFDDANTNSVALIAASESKLNKILPEFASYRAPKVGVFMSDEEFASLPKEYSFGITSDGTYYFGRLFTCGVNHGRPDTPFHQGFIFDSTDINKVITVLNSKANGFGPRPADLAFAANWVLARGETEVNAAEIGSHSFPFPELRSADLSQIHHQAFDASDNAKEIVTRFGKAIYFGSDCALPMEEQARFSNWVSLLTHLVPQVLAWRMPFTSLQGASTSVPHSTFSAVRLGGSQTNGGVSSAVEVWSEIVMHAFNNGLDTELVAGIDSMTSNFLASSTVADPNAKYRNALSAVMLAYLFMDQDFFEDETSVLADRVVNACFEIGFPSGYRSESARDLVGNWMDSGDRLIHASAKSDMALGLLLDLPVSQ